MEIIGEINLWHLRFELRFCAKCPVAIGKFTFVRPLTRMQVHVFDKFCLADNLYPAGLAHNLGLFLFRLLSFIVRNLRTFPEESVL